MARPDSDDDAALRWDDVDDPSHVDPGQLDPGAGSASGIDPETDADRTPDTAGNRPAAGLQLLTALFAVVYVLWSVGWIIGVGLLPLNGPTVLIEVLYQFSEFLAIVASALWFATTVSLTRDGRAAVRGAWLALGTLVLLPWPFVLGVIA